MGRPKKEVDEVVEDDKPKKKKVKANFRQEIEEYAKKDIWLFFKEKLHNVTALNVAVNVLTHCFGDTIHVNDKALIKIIEDGLENKEFAEDAFWIKWLPGKKGRKKDKENDNGEEKVKSKMKQISFSFVCNKCNKKGTIDFEVFDGSDVLGLRSRRCGGCGEWGTLTVEGIVNGKKLKVTTYVNENGAMMEKTVK